jgi:hypothetical protein
MASTNQLIHALSADVGATRAFGPRTHMVRLLGGLLVYALVLQISFLGFRVDLAAQTQRPLFAAELFLLLSIIVSAAIVAVYAMYPDMYQKRGMLVIPYGGVAVLLAIMGLQLFMADDPRMVLPTEDAHTIECTLYIGLSSLLPAFAMFAYLKKGATTVPRHAGMLIVIAATAVGALTLRLHEALDMASHQLLWHYGPNLFFALLGAILGRFILRW